MSFEKEGGGGGGGGKSCVKAIFREPLLLAWTVVDSVDTFLDIAQGLVIIGSSASSCSSCSMARSVDSVLDSSCARHC